MGRDEHVLEEVAVEGDGGDVGELVLDGGLDLALEVSKRVGVGGGEVHAVLVVAIGSVE